MATTNCNFTSIGEFGANVLYKVYAPQGTTWQTSASTNCIVTGTSNTTNTTSGSGNKELNLDFPMLPNGSAYTNYIVSSTTTDGECSGTSITSFIQSSGDTTPCEFISMENMNDQIERIDYIDLVELRTNGSGYRQVYFSAHCTDSSTISTTEPCFVSQFKINGPYDGYYSWGQAISGVVEPPSSNFKTTVATVKFYKNRIHDATSFGIVFSGHSASDSDDSSTDPFEIYFGQTIK